MVVCGNYRQRLSSLVTNGNAEGDREVNLRLAVRGLGHHLESISWSCRGTRRPIDGGYSAKGVHLVRYASSYDENYHLVLGTLRLVTLNFLLRKLNSNRLYLDFLVIIAVTVKALS